MAIRVSFPCPDCGGTNLRASRSGNCVMKAFAGFIWLKAMRCRECNNRNYFPSFMPERSLRGRELTEEPMMAPAQTDMLRAEF